MSSTGAASSVNQRSPKVLAGAPTSSRVPDAVAGDARPAGDRGVAGDLGRMPEKTPRACGTRFGRRPHRLDQAGPPA